MRLSLCVGLCIALLGVSTPARDPVVDPSLPAYRPVAGVVGVITCHSSAAMSELMTAWGTAFERIYPGVRVELDDAASSSMMSPEAP